ncbi:MAG: hypothetical protein GY847_17225 [Proteobacteria bacterium]|nr:hypothetical protein [Pseudomonadota bacterium]
MQEEAMERIEKQKEMLLERHPDLKKLDTFQINKSDLTYNEVSAFMEKCWGNDYGSELRIKYPPEYLEYILGDKNEDTICGIVAEGSTIRGIGLGVRLDYSYEDQIIKTHIGTGTCVDPDYRGKGVGQLIGFLGQESLVETDTALGFAWMDSRHKWKGSEWDIFVEDLSKEFMVTMVRFYAKSLVYKKSVQYGKLNAFQKLGLKAARIFMPSKKKLSPGYEIKQVSEDDISQCINFINEYQKPNKIKRYFLEDELKKKLIFSKEKTSVIALMMMKKGKFRGLLYGITNPADGDDCYFQMDGLILHPELSFNEKRKFLATSEYYILENYGCFSMIVSSTVSKEKLVKYGYGPIGTQAICLGHDAGYVPFDNKMFSNLFIEVR